MKQQPGYLLIRDETEATKGRASPIPPLTESHFFMQNLQGCILHLRKHLPLQEAQIAPVTALSRKLGGPAGIIWESSPTLKGSKTPEQGDAFQGGRSPVTLEVSLEEPADPRPPGPSTGVAKFSSSLADLRWGLETRPHE